MERQKKARSWPRPLLLVAVLAVSVPAAGMAAGAAIYNSSQDSEASVVRIVIPAGAAAKTKSGSLSSAVPSVIKGRVGQKLILVNNDSEAHQVGPFQVAAHNKLEAPLWRVGVYYGLCNLTPGGRMKLIIKP